MEMRGGLPEDVAIDSITIYSKLIIGWQLGDVVTFKDADIFGKEAKFRVVKISKEMNHGIEYYLRRVNTDKPIREYNPYKIGAGDIIKEIGAID